jgi:hypothetical protein
MALTPSRSSGVTPCTPCVARLRVHELVVAEPVQASRDGGRHGVEPIAALLGGAREDLLGHARPILSLARRRIERRLLGAVDPILDPGPLAVDDPAEPLVDVAEHAVQVGPFELVAALLSEALHDPPQARDVAAPRARHAALHEPLERAADVTLREDVVAQGAEDIVRVEWRQLLAAVPPRVAPARHSPAA